MTKLLTIDGNPKTVKGNKLGYMTAVMHLAPYKAAGINVCPMAELAGCHAGCLNTAGRGGIAKGGATTAPYGVDVPDNAIQAARIRRTRWYAEDRDGFMRQLVTEIRAFVRKAERKGLVPAVRLNGTSDIQWELIGISSRELGIFGAANIFEVFPSVQFYDYTKLAKRFRRELPANYHLSLSYSEASERYRDMCRETFEAGASLVAVVRSESARAWLRGLAELHGRELVDGDETDLRFTDPAGAVVILKAKGSARKDQSGFVLD